MSDALSNLANSAAAQKAVARVQALQTELTPLLARRLSFEPDKAVYLSERADVVEVRIVPVCSYGVQSKSTLWAWCNPDIEIPQAFGEAMFRELAEATKITEFLARQPIDLTDDQARMLLALIVDHVDARGLLSEQYGDTVWSFLVTGTADAHPDEVRLLVYRLLDEALSAPSMASAVEQFNGIRARYPELTLDFAGADLRGDAQPWKGDAHAQPAIDHGFVTEHEPRSLDGIDLSRCTLTDVKLNGLSLQGASFAGSNLINADFSQANLTGANLQGAFLNGANFFGSRLDQVRLAGAEIGRTLLVDVDLSTAVGLDTVQHSTSSEISFSTLVRSSFKIGERFLRAAGVSMGLLDDLRRGQRFATTYRTCFLSYSTKDAEFAQQLYYALQEAGVRVYWDRCDLTPGEDLDEQLRRAIAEHDMTIAVLSDHSVQSVWLEREVKIALYYKPEGFTPIRLCEIPPIQSFVVEKEIKPDIVQRYPILNFADWQNPVEFARCRDLLLKSIRR